MNAKGTSGGRQRRVLLIDNDESVRLALQELISLLGFASDTAASGPDGLALFGQHPYDVVLTDLSMPGMTGWEVLEALRQRSPSIPVILVTGSAVRVNDPRLAQPNVALVRKPVDAALLESVLALLLGDLP